MILTVAHYTDVQIVMGRGSDHQRLLGFQGVEVTSHLGAVTTAKPPVLVLSRLPAAGGSELISFRHSSHLVLGRLPVPLSPLTPKMDCCNNTKE